MKSSNSHSYHKEAIYLIGHWEWDWGDQATFVLQHAYHTTRCESYTLLNTQVPIIGPPLRVDVLDYILRHFTYPFWSTSS